ncbi:DUF3310 domain-containing protein [Ornithinibacillus xuwenensis]|uniref:DUF3310 domain-containing protein n=1 Tax=Ornithinibacillus xuwenensis TaxID=3144668 RepID=A0ABU9XBW0_9BACI
MSLPSEFKFRPKHTENIFIAKETDTDDFTIFSKDDTQLFKTPVKELAEMIGKGEWVIVDDKYGKSPSDNVNHPSHYQGKTEVIEIIEQATKDLPGFQAYCIGNVLKYVMRHQKKGGMEDLKKASWYLNKVIGGENE